MRGQYNVHGCLAHGLFSWMQVNQISRPNRELPLTKEVGCGTTQIFQFVWQIWRFTAQNSMTLWHLNAADSGTRYQKWPALMFFCWSSRVSWFSLISWRTSLYGQAMWLPRRGVLMKFLVYDWKLSKPNHFEIFWNIYFEFCILNVFFAASRDQCNHHQDSCIEWFQEQCEAVWQSVVRINFQVNRRLLCFQPQTCYGVVPCGMLHIL